MSVSIARAIRALNATSLTTSATSVLTGILADANGEEVACKYYPNTTSPITHIDFFITAVGDLSAVNFRVRVESDTSDAPNASVLGTQSAEFAGPATSNFTGAQALGSNTGTLTLNVPVWLILFRSSGSSLSGALSAQLNGTTTSQLGICDRQRHFPSGGNWTTTTPTNTACRMVVTHLDGTVVGFPITGNPGNPTGVTDIFGTNRQGVKVGKYGAQFLIPAVMLRLTKTGSPGNLVVEVFEGTTSKYSQTVPAASIVSTVAFPVIFTSPVLLAADTNIYIVLKQESDGGTDAADYDSNGYPITSGYVAAMLPPDARFVSGASNDPSALTASTTFVPQIWPLLDDPAADLDMAAGGGGGARFQTISGGGLS